MGRTTPGRLADYRRQFERTVRRPRDSEDPSDFAVALETLAVKAFRDMGLDVRTHLIRDQFIAGHPDCDQQRHLDSVPPETPIRDIVDSCRVWESHADTDDWRVVKPTPESPQPVYAVSELTLGLTEQVTVAAVTGPSVRLAYLETMLKRLLPYVPAQAPPPRFVPTDLETMLTRMLLAVPAQPPRPASTEIEAMLKRLLLGKPTQAPKPRPVIARRDWSSVLCFSCGKYGHGLGKCRRLDVTFPFMGPGWSADKRGDHYMMVSPHLAAGKGNQSSGMEGQPPGSVIISDPRTRGQWIVHHRPYEDARMDLTSSGNSRP